MSEHQAPITIVKQPVSVTMRYGTAVFQVTATGDGLQYQWQQYNERTGQWDNIPSSSPSFPRLLNLLTGTSISGERTAALRVPVTSNRYGALFRCVISNAEGRVISDEVTIHRT